MSKVMILKSGSVDEFEVDEITNKKIGLKYLQNAVGGYIEIPFLSNKLLEKNIDLVINEEGKLEGLEPTIIVINKGQIVDVVVGNIVFVSHDEECNNIGLNDGQIQFIKETLKEITFVENEKDTYKVRVLEV